jgi:plasmid stabilization system protein ParE
MDFRVELSEQAQRDIAAIYDWLQSQQAGDAGERWFQALRAAVDSLTNLPSRCPLAPRIKTHPLTCGTFSMAGARTFIESCLRSKATSCRCSTFDMAAVGHSAVSEQSVLNLLPNTG